MIRDFMNEESGQGLVEYALIIAGVSIAITAALITFRKELVKVFTTLATKLNSAQTP